MLFVLTSIFSVLWSRNRQCKIFVKYWTQYGCTLNILGWFWCLWWVDWGDVRDFLILCILNYLTMEYWKIAVAILPSRQSVFPSELLKLSWQSPQIGNTRKYSSSRAGPIRVRILPREYTDPYWASSRSQYKKMLASRGNWELLYCVLSRCISVFHC